MESLCNDVDQGRFQTMEVLQQWKILKDIAETAARDICGTIRVRVIIVPIKEVSWAECIDKQADLAPKPTLRDDSMDIDANETEAERMERLKRKADGTTGETPTNLC